MVLCVGLGVLVLHSHSAIGRSAVMGHGSTFWLNSNGYMGLGLLGEGGLGMDLGVENG